MCSPLSRAPGIVQGALSLPGASEELSGGKQLALVRIPGEHHKATIATDLRMLMCCVCEMGENVSDSHTAGVSG